MLVIVNLILINYFTWLKSYVKRSTRVTFKKKFIIKSIFFSGILYETKKKVEATHSHNEIFTRNLGETTRRRKKHNRGVYQTGNNTYNWKNKNEKVKKKKN